jgi:hypothetical protein
VKRRAAFLVEQNAERQRKRMMAEPLEIVVQLLDPRFVADRRIRVRSAGVPFRRIDAVLSMDVIQVFGLRVIRLEVVIGQRPRGRDARMVSNLKFPLLDP